MDAWEVSLPNWPEAPARIEAAAVQGKPVRFQVNGPWDREDGAESTQNDTIEQIIDLILNLFLLFAIVGGIFFAYRNIRLGRGDRRGANRLSIFILIGHLLALVLKWPEISFNNFLLNAPYSAGLTWILYIAIEPYARRHWPKVIISWTRLLSGEWKDPLVARDIMYGCAAGTLYYFIKVGSCLIPIRDLFDGLNQPPIPNVVAFQGTNFFMSDFLQATLLQTFLSLAMLCTLIFARRLLRSQTAAVIVCILCVSLAWSGGYVGGLLQAILWFFVLTRIGLVAAMFCMYSMLLIADLLLYPVQMHTWYSYYGYFALVIFAVIVLYSFRTSLGGRPIFGTTRLDE